MQTKLFEIFGNKRSKLEEHPNKFSTDSDYINIVFFFNNTSTNNIILTKVLNDSLMGL